jgi:hypothetical protein
VTPTNGFCLSPKSYERKNAAQMFHRAAGLERNGTRLGASPILVPNLINNHNLADIRRLCLNKHIFEIAILSAFSLLV